MRRIFYVLFCVVGCAFAVMPAYANTEPAAVSSHNDWKVYSFPDSGEKVCFMSAQPQKQEGKFKKRGEVFFFVTRWPGDTAKNVVSVSNGYSFKAGSQATVKVDGRRFYFFTQGEMAWTKDQTVDDVLAEAIRQGAVLVVEGTSTRGTQTTDTYDLNGVSAAYQAMTQECNRKTKS